MAALKGEKTLSELAQQFDVHANQITQWKTQLQDGAVALFGGEAKAETAEASVDLKTLHAKIGQLTLENDYLVSITRSKPTVFKAWASSICARFGGGWQRIGRIRIVFGT